MFDTYYFPPIHWKGLIGKIWVFPQNCKCNKIRNKSWKCYESARRFVISGVVTISKNVLEIAYLHNVLWRGLGGPAYAPVAYGDRPSPPLPTCPAAESTVISHKIWIIQDNIKLTYTFNYFCYYRVFFNKLLTTCSILISDSKLYKK